ncbi:uncharacterized protein [Linepithema humile]|uniref:uncharacterized protein n=1 Tax=Linepithema humile TaxID=83485 RepID=UPI00351E38D1
MPKTRSMMDREDLKKAVRVTPERGSEISITGLERPRHIDRTNFNLERAGHTKRTLEMPRETGEIHDPAESSSRRATEAAPPNAEALCHAITEMTAMMQQQQQILLQVLQRLASQEANVPISRDKGIAGPSGLVTLSRATSGNVHLNHSNFTNNGQSRMLSNASALPAGNAVSWLASQIPEFGESDDENVEVWTNRVDKVAEIHGASDGITLLAASSKLVKFARQWYEIQMGEMIETWQALKSELMKMFRKQVPFYKAIQKIEARK